MSKRKVVGGYEESSDGELDIDTLANADPRLKRSKSMSFAPPRLTTTSKLGAFQLPGGTAFPTRGSAPPRHVSLSSGRSTPVSDSTQTARNTPEISIPQGSGMRSSMPSELLSAGSGGAKASLNSANEHYKLAHARSILGTERQLNDISDALSGDRVVNDERYCATSEKLNSILEAVKRLESIANLAPRQALDSLSSITTVLSSPETTNLCLSNPLPSPELIAIVSSVVAESRGRVGKKRGGVEDNTCKEHARNTFYKMLGISAAREIRPFFEDDYGEPDTLPADFVDPDTLYCRPYPHWKLPLTKQVRWIPTFIVRFQTTIPKDDSDTSKLLQSLTVKQIVTLLNDGPFKSAQAAWRSLEKTDLEVSAMQSDARRYQRTEKKSVTRALYFKTIPSLQGTEWEYLSHPGYTSQDESDGEGGIVTMRPRRRPGWENNLYEAVRVAEAVKDAAKPGFHPRPLRRIELVDRPIPQLERGKGNAKVVIRIPYCGISKSWREENKEEFHKYLHLVDMKVIRKPDITAFLLANPMVKNEDSEGGNSHGELVGEHGSAEGQVAPTDNESAKQLIEWRDEDYEEEESGLVLDLAERHGSLASFGIHGETDEPGTTESTTQSNIPIDPQLLTQDARMDTLPALSKSGSHDINAAEPTQGDKVVPSSTNPAHNPTAPALRANEMPPPPLLDQNPAKATTTSQSSSSEKRQTRSGTMGQSVALHVGNQFAQPAKRRGRPPGSKNKKKDD
ncbi:hypothetical protein FRC09_002066 [Ceratobasidium sp. 395]|nr:hypothetical protein FRC09_002066 [Ceratobasidium sp. 395]